MKTFGNYPPEYQIEGIIKKQFQDQTGLEAEIVDHCFPFDRNITIHTKNRTFEGLLTHSARRIQKDTLKEIN